MYHNNNDCYKKKLQAIEEAELGECVDSDEEMNMLKSGITQPMVRRSSVTHEIRQVWDWAFGAFDNEDFDDKSSILGTHSKHYTAQVLHQETTMPAMSKPSVSSTNLSKSSCPPKNKLPRQIVFPHHKPSVKPTLPQNFLLVKNTNADIMTDSKKAIAYYHFFDTKRTATFHCCSW